MTRRRGFLKGEEILSTFMKEGEILTTFMKGREILTTFIFEDRSLFDLFVLFDCFYSLTLEV